MSHRLRTGVLTALFSAVAVLAPGTASPVAAAPPKVAIIVGPTGITDSHYHPWAKELAETARAAGAEVDLRYCPTPKKAKAAVDGASIIVYFGHGNGFPNPYSSTENPLSVNGWGLRDPGRDWNGTSCRDNVLRYYGESYLTGKASGYGWDLGAITPAADFVMVYSNACYAPGAGESRPAPSSAVARSRVSNYSTPILELGGTYFATDLGSERLVDLILRNPTVRFGKIFEMGNGFDAGALRTSEHPEDPDAQVWIQKTTSAYLGTDYWYAFAGDPARKPNGDEGSPWTPPAPSTEVTRLAGTDRYGTAAQVSKASFAPGVPVAYVATGANFPDALAAGAAAVRAGGPVLLVGPTSIPYATHQELTRLAPARIKVVGGSAMISDAVVASLGRYATSGSATRLSGANRYATAAQISADAFAPGVSVAYVATGTNFPDALSGVAAAGSGGGPVLLTEPGWIPPETRSELRRLDPERIVVLGGTSVITEEVRAALAPLARSGRADRHAGSDRYATAVDVSAGTFGPETTVAFVATGLNFPDALGGGPVAGSVPGPLLLVPGTTVPSTVAAELRRLDPDRVVILGGTSVVAPSVEGQIADLLGG